MTPTPFENTKGSFLFVEVPDGSFGHHIKPVSSTGKHILIWNISDNISQSVPAFNSKYEILGCTDAEDFPCEEVVESGEIPTGDQDDYRIRFVNYEKGITELIDPKESFQSLMKSLGLEGRFCVLKKI